MTEIGLDIGGTKISGVCVNKGKVVSELKLLTPGDLNDFKLALKGIIVYLSRGRKVDRIGLAVAGVMDRNKGIICHSPNLKFINNFKIKAYLGSLGFKDVRLENDANCFALAESVFGKGRGAANFVGLTLGTGLGGGLISRGQLYLGMHGSAGEPGHMMADEKFTYEKLFQRHKAKSDWKGVGKLLGRLTADIINLLDVEIIILGGSVARKFGKTIVPAAKKEAQKHLLNKQIKPKILVSGLRHAGAFGATLLFKNTKSN